MQLTRSRAVPYRNSDRAFDRWVRCLEVLVNLYGSLIIDVDLGETFAQKSV